MLACYSTKAPFNSLIFHFAVFSDLKHIWRVFNFHEFFIYCISWHILTTQISSAVFTLTPAFCRSSAAAGYSNTLTGKPGDELYSPF